ncbi:hypothetical protein Pedsa_0270 [Pseudopedobacter saltans DSM 12145]|uniref:Uncharacterized protein n=1 Tax=Pseudopedobacter saltans (strain ATCC 51119 / DSM 12145 / JCM 21818 / CCUG 39354 / LMG 10337 / NBRC 100064 / NCIMB 13643) TaxID=762903 RepID=F0SEJ0_PSESL|nr:hypothetical protein [Pseudopedobacter saltans]ADY50855.1 hypothetical protein Pedsa_0270 [Pseudopedobacter saltans DSM 12145]
MNAIRRFLGIVWMIVGIVAGYYLLVSQAIPKFGTGTTEDLVPAIIYSFILAPIITGGMFVFGLYCLQGEYDFKD